MSPGFTENICLCLRCYWWNWGLWNYLYGSLWNWRHWRRRWSLLWSCDCSAHHPLCCFCYPTKRSTDLTKYSCRRCWSCWDISYRWNYWSLSCQRIGISWSFRDKFYDSFYKFFQKSFRRSHWSRSYRNLCWSYRSYLNWLNWYLHLWHLWDYLHWRLWRWLYRSSCISYKIVWISRCLCWDLCLHRIHFKLLFTILNILYTA